MQRLVCDSSSNENYTNSSIGDPPESPLRLVKMGKVKIAKFRLENLPNYKGSGNPRISEYVGERTSSKFADHMMQKNQIECAMNRHSENIIGGNIWYTDEVEFRT